MNKVDRERADVLRAELARLCWLTIYDNLHDGESERLLQERLAAERAAATRLAADDVCPPLITASDLTEGCRR